MVNRRREERFEEPDLHVVGAVDDAGIVWILPSTLRRSSSPAPSTVSYKETVIGDLGMAIRMNSSEALDMVHAEEAPDVDVERTPSPSYLSPPISNYSLHYHHHHHHQPHHSPSLVMYIHHIRSYSNLSDV